MFPLRRCLLPARRFHNPRPSNMSYTLSRPTFVYSHMLSRFSTEAKANSSANGGEEFVIEFKSPAPARVLTGGHIDVAQSPQRPPFLPTDGAPASDAYNQFMGTDDELCPPYCIVHDFDEKKKLLGWKITTDVGMGGTSEGSLAWGKCINPITNQPMRTLVFHGRIGAILVKQSDVRPGGTVEGVARPKEGLDPNSPEKRDFAGGVKPEFSADVHEKLAGAGMAELQGFIGLQGPVFDPPIDPLRWDTYNMLVRTDDGPWMATVKPVTGRDNDLFQTSVPTAGESPAYPRKVENSDQVSMRNIFVSVADFAATAGGREKIGFKASTEIPFAQFGFSLRGPPGPFRIEIGWVAMSNSEQLPIQGTERPRVSPSLHTPVDFTPAARHQLQYLSEEELKRYAAKQKSAMDARVRQTIAANAEDPDAALSRMVSVEMDSQMASIFKGRGSSAAEEETLTRLQKAARDRGYDEPVIVPTLSVDAVVQEAMKFNLDRLSASEERNQRIREKIDAEEADIMAQVYPQTRRSRRRVTRPVLDEDLDGGYDARRAQEELLDPLEIAKRNPLLGGSRLNPEYLREFDSRGR